MNVISISLWGDNPRYLVGARKNIELAKEYYPDWKCRFYADKSVHSVTLKGLHDAGAEVYLVENPRDKYHGMFWRFFPASDSTVDRFIVRDADSRLNTREAVAVQEWIDSGLPFHIMRDHPHHELAIMGGTWGAVKGCIPNMTDPIEQWGLYHCKGIDQTFLNEKIWPLIKGKHLAHDSQYRDRFPGSKPFPEHGPMKFGGTFVGEIFDESDKQAEWLPY